MLAKCVQVAAPFFPLPLLRLLVVMPWFARVDKANEEDEGKREGESEEDEEKEDDDDDEAVVGRM